MELAAGEESEYGCRKLAICLKRQHNLVINHKKVYRLCKELDILAPQRRIKIKHPRRLAINRQVTASDQLWKIDVKY
ncbi:MAG: IS3 family transposase [Bacillota bacterium]|jgi:putative transposase